MLYLMACLLSVGLAGPPAAAGAPPPVETLRPIYLRIEVMDGTLKTIPCRIEASRLEEGSYDRAVLDLDGDGRFEKTVEAEKGRYGSSKDRFGTTLPLVLGSATYQIELSGSSIDPFEGEAYLLWSVKKEDAYLWFINGKVKLYPTVEAAAAGKALRLGPPFHFEASTSTRGADALVNVGCKDANGATLRVAQRNRKESERGEESRIHVEFVRDGKTCSSIVAEYG